MTTTFSQQPQQQDTAPASLPDLSTLSTLWVPLYEARQAWATFGQEALTTSALMATSTAFGGLYWETHALQHYTWAADERERERWHRVVFWLSRAVQDLDCALDQWQQVQRMLDLAGNDHRQQDPETLELIRSLMAQVQWHQGRRRLLHQQVLNEYITARSTSSSSGKSRAENTRPNLWLRHESRRGNDGNAQRTTCPASVW